LVVLHGNLENDAAVVNDLVYLAWLVKSAEEDVVTFGVLNYLRTAITEIN